MAGEIFISYRRADQDKARLLHALLKQRGVDGWYDALVGAGEDWRHRTAEALSAAPIFVLLFSKLASESDDISKELAAATFSKKLVIPVRIDDIQPAGAFLYELASRNWFDAFEDTEARFEILADKLAALVKGGPEADAAAFNLGSAQAAPVIRPAQKALLRRRAVLAGLAAAALAVAATGLYFLLGSPSAVIPPSQRVAFFGFTAGDDNPLSKKIAAETTDKTFAELARMRMDVAAKADSVVAPGSDRLTRARELSAAYALSGEVNTDGEMARMVIRMEDPATRATLWEGTEPSPVARPFYSPSTQAAFRAASSLSCVVALRAELSSENTASLNGVVTYCSNLADVEVALTAARTLARQEPRSAFFKAHLASQLVNQSGRLPEDLRVERVQEASALANEAVRMTPGDPFVVAIAAFARGVENSPLGAEQLLQTATSDGSPFGQGYLLFWRGLELLGNGRTAEGVARLKEAESVWPSVVIASTFRAVGLASLGQAADAEVLFEQTFARAPDAANLWRYWARASVLEGVGDPDAVIAAAPDSEPRANVACHRSLLAAKPKGKMETCAGFPGIAAAGRGHDAIALYRAISPLPLAPDSRMRFFTPSARSMRADPGFLPLMKDLGLWEYWIATGSRPDVCNLSAERSIEVCVALRAEQAGK